ncbi:MAG: BatD family protein, partial [Paramuribaculum sp.]|nr:BatD family protein [Paramuribaculum sp.]
YTISGTGNIKYLQEPKIDFPSEFEQYSPKSDIQASVSGNNVSGKMTVEYTFVPQSVGDFRIGGDKFVYFNPTTKEYVTLDTQGYNIKVAKGLSVSNDVEQKDIELKNTDIRHIKLGDKHPSKVHSFVIAQWWYWGIYLLVFASMIAFLAINRHNIKKMADVQGMKLAKANKVAKKRLKLARSYMDKKEDDKFYDEMLHAVWGYLSDKLGIPVSQLSRDNVAYELSKLGVSEELSNKFKTVLDDCEMARYATASLQPTDVFEQASSAINELENIKSVKH